MKVENVIEVNNIFKFFKVYLDKGRTLKELLLFKNRRRFEERKAINGVSFDVKKGEVLGLIGENGCGKSTILKLLTGIMYPDAGTIDMKGRVSSLIELGAGFHPDMSGRENIYINASIFGLTRKEIDSRVNKIIEFSELEEYIDNPVRTYSSGMYMRLAFAVAINVDADILLIDEILAVGDANFQSKCFSWLRKLKQNGVTIVIVTHDTGLVERFCNKAMWINHGISMAYGASPKVVDAYLSYMNQKKIDALKQEKKDNNTDDSDEYNENNNKKNMIKEKKIEDIDMNSNHFGLGNILIDNVTILDQNKNEVKILSEGKNYKIAIAYSVKEKIDDYVFGIGIFTMGGQCVMGNNTQIDRIAIRNLPMNGEVVCELFDLPLLSGQYVLNVAIVDPFGTPMDYYRDYMHFEVISKSKDIGNVSIKHKWEGINFEYEKKN